MVSLDGRLPLKCTVLSTAPNKGQLPVLAFLRKPLGTETVAAAQKGRQLESWVSGRKPFLSFNLDLPQDRFLSVLTSGGMEIDL